MYDLNKIKPLPEDFNEWIESNLPKEPIFFKNHKGYSDLLCGHCGEKSTIYLEDGMEDLFDIPWEKPKRFDLAVCPLCGYEGYYEIGQVRAEHVNYEYFAIVQQDTDGNLVSRCFSVRQAWRKGVEAGYKIIEVDRYVCMPGRMIKIKKNWHWYTGEEYWQECSHGRMTFTEKATLYEEGPGYNLTNEIKTSTLPYFDPNLYFSMFSQYGYEAEYAYQVLKSLAMYANAPWSESFAKMGWFDVLKGTMNQDGSTSLLNKRGKTLKSQLRLKNSENVHFFQEQMKVTSNKWYRILGILQMAEKNGKRYTGAEYTFLMNVYDLKEPVELLKYMTLTQLVNRIKEYRRQKEAAEKRQYADNYILTEYRDYLRLRRELGYDMTNEVYIHPKNLFEKHQELITEQQLRRDSERKKEMEKLYQGMNKVYETLCKIYCWESKGYIIRPAKSPSELIAESQALHHCVGSGETYMRKHARGESYILFLRKKKTPDVPFTTIEISGVKEKEPRILQWYEAHDKKPDEEILQPIIDKYVEHLKKGMKKPGKRAKAS